MFKMIKKVYKRKKYGLIRIRYDRRFYLSINTIRFEHLMLSESIEDHIFETCLYRMCAKYFSANPDKDDILKIDGGTIFGILE